MKARSPQSAVKPHVRGFLIPTSRFAHTKYVVLGATLMFGTAFILQSNKLRKHTIRVPAQVTTLSVEEYDLPTLLKVPLMVVEGEPATRYAIDERAARLSSARPGSVISIYRSIPSKCAMQPYIPHVKEALRKFGETPGRKVWAEEDLVRDNTTLLLSICSAKANINGVSLSPEFVAQVIERARDFSRVIVLPSLAKSGTLAGAEADVEHIMQALKQARINVIRHRSKGEDDDVYLMHIASNLLVHRGSFSALGALVNDGSVYYTSELDEYMKKNQFKWLLNDGQTAIHKNITLPQLHFKNMGPIHPSCCTFEAFGKGDGEKIVCSNAKSFTQDKCWILSLGCQGKFSFEKRIAERTKCHIHTFDCTGEWPVPDYLEGRLTIHKTCLGADDDTRENFVGWKEVLEMGKTKGASKMPSLVKMDIEGSEYPVLQPLLVSGDDSLLPHQMAIEIHAYKRSPDFVRDMFGNFTRRGYSLIHRADNPYCPHCSEITIIKNTDLPPVV